MDKEYIMKQQADLRGRMGIGQAMGAMGPMAPMDTEGPRDNRPMGPEAIGFDYELRRLVTRARWGLSDAAVLEIMGMVANELHAQLEQANRD